MCEIARKLLDGPDRVGRIIATPFTNRNIAAYSAAPRLCRRSPETDAARCVKERSVPDVRNRQDHDIYNGAASMSTSSTRNNRDGNGPS